MNAPQDAWRESFSGNAGDLLAIIRWAEGLDAAAFQALLLACFKHQLRQGSRAGLKINTLTVERVLQRRLETHKAEYPELYAGLDS